MSTNYVIREHPDDPSVASSSGTRQSPSTRSKYLRLGSGRNHNSRFFGKGPWAPQTNATSFTKIRRKFLNFLPPLVSSYKRHVFWLHKKGRVKGEKEKTKKQTIDVNPVHWFSLYRSPFRLPCSFSEQSSSYPFLHVSILTQKPYAVKECVQLKKVSKKDQSNHLVFTGHIINRHRKDFHRNTRQTIFRRTTQRHSPSFFTRFKTDRVDFLFRAKITFIFSFRHPKAYHRFWVTGDPSFALPLGFESHINVYKYLDRALEEARMTQMLLNGKSRAAGKLKYLSVKMLPEKKFSKVIKSSGKDFTRLRATEFWFL